MAAASFTQPTYDMIQANLEAFRTYYTDTLKQNNWLDGIHTEVDASIQKILDAEFTPFNDDELQLPLTPELVRKTFCEHVELGLRLTVLPDDRLDIGMSASELTYDELLQVATNPAAIRVLNYLPALFETVFDDVSVFGFDEPQKSGMYYACGVAMANVWNSGQAVYSNTDLLEMASVMFEQLNVTPQNELVKSCAEQGRTLWGFVEECNANNLGHVATLFMEWARPQCPLDAVFDRDRKFASRVTNASFRNNLIRQIVMFYLEFSQPSRLLSINAPFDVRAEINNTYYNSGQIDDAMALIQSCTTQTHQKDILDSFLAWWARVNSNFEMGL